MRSLAAFALFSSSVTFLTGCGSSEERRQSPADSDVATLTEEAVVVIPPDAPELDPNYVPEKMRGLQLVEGAALFCPEGFSYSAAARLCASAAEARGPFTAKMISKCKQYGGGPACDGSTWSRAFAEKLRGTGECPDGAVKSAKGLCVEGAEAFGPFTVEHVSNCQAAGGGPACESLRWSAAFAEKTLPQPPAPAPVPGDLSGLKIAIDSGHGRNFYKGKSGFDVGAVSPIFSSVIEWERNADVADRVKSKLQAMGAKVSLFKYLNVAGVPYLTLEEKGARAAGHDLFVSIHHNSYDSKAQGSETLVHTYGGQADRNLAAAIQRNLVKFIWDGSSARNRGVKSANLGVLRGVPASVDAAVLVEGFFLDTPAVTLDVAKALDVRTAEAVVQGVTQYWVEKN